MEHASTLPGGPRVEAGDPPMNIHLYHRKLRTHTQAPSGRSLQQVHVLSWAVCSCEPTVFPTIAIRLSRNTLCASLQTSRRHRDRPLTESGRVAQCSRPDLEAEDVSRWCARRLICLYARLSIATPAMCLPARLTCGPSTAARTHLECACSRWHSCHRHRVNRAPCLPRLDKTRPNASWLSSSNN